MNTVYLLLGGNIGNTKNIFEKTQLLIQKKIGDILSQSANYKSESWGFESSCFLNKVIIIKTTCKASDLLKQTQEIEKLLGRKAKTKKQYESRIIDIDILFYNNEIIKSSKLTIPHPRLHLRRFTLEPLLELSPNLKHPILQKTISAIYQECKDKAEVIKVLD